MFMVFIFMLAQLELPPLPSPTPWASPTPNPTQDGFINEANEALDSADEQQYQFSADGTQVWYEGEAILPDLEDADNVNLVAYSKWVVNDAGFALMGPFAPLMIPFSLLVTLSLISLLVYFWENVIVTIFKFVAFIIRSIARLIGTFT